MVHRHFSTIKAKQIREWSSGNLEARQLLPVLLRKLVHSTGIDLRQVDFPGYDNAERRGPDGLIDARSETPWIPGGKSYWEFGTNQDPKAKAESDYVARLASVPQAERVGCTFVFVTPRNWPAKTDWAEAKNVAGAWQAVRALDASDLEQWLEHSLPARTWLCGKNWDRLSTDSRHWMSAGSAGPREVSLILHPRFSSHRSPHTATLSNHG